MGHWHEILNGDTIHCYFISDTIVSVDQFTFGYSRKVVNEEIYELMVERSTFELLKDYKIKGDRIAIGDSVLWVKMQNDINTFLSDLAIGLLVNVEPPELN